MLKNFGHLALASLFVIAFASPAVAQDENDMGGMDEEPPADDWSSDDTAATAPTESAPAADGGDALTMAISVPLFEGGIGDLAALAGGEAAFSTANLFYGLDADTFLNLQLGVNFGPGATIDDGMGNQISGDDVFGLKVGVGYRMYKPTEGKIRPYLEPSVTVAIPDFSNAGDVIDVGLGARMGVDYALLQQLTIGTSIGADLFLANGFDSVNFNLLTTQINATFWW